MQRPFPATPPGLPGFTSPQSPETRPSSPAHSRRRVDPNPHRRQTAVCPREVRDSGDLGRVIVIPRSAQHRHATEQIRFVHRRESRYLSARLVEGLRLDALLERPHLLACRDPDSAHRVVRVVHTFKTVDQRTAYQRRLVLEIRGPWIGLLWVPVWHPYTHYLHDPENRALPALLAQAQAKSEPVLICTVRDAVEFLQIV